MRNLLLSVVFFFGLVGITFSQESERDKALRRLLPKVSDEQLQEKLNGSLFFYTEADIPRVHQDWEGALRGVHSSWNNVSANDSEPFGNGNKEFPWGDPAGTHRVSNLYKFRFLYLPPREAGGKYPIVWSGDDRGGYRWTFPRDAIVGEVLSLYDSEGKAWAFELRTRERSLGSWEPDIYKPFPTAKMLREEAEKLGLRTLVAQLDKPDISLPGISVKARHPNPSVNAISRVDTLPAIPEEAVKTLLNREFHSSVANDWREKCAAPTTKAAFHIVPASYEASVFSVPGGCVNCHADTNRHVSEFESFLQTRRDWYGRVRGSDGIFSLHPFSKESASTNGHPQPISMNRRLVELGIFAQYNPRIHPRDRYQTIPGLR